MYSSKVFFSIIIPCFNVEETINKTINSVLNQDFVDYEIIAINDGSNDKTFEVISKLKSISFEEFSKITSRNFFNLFGELN